MNEHEFSTKIVRFLDRKALNPAVHAKLAAARERALARVEARQPVRSPALAGVGGFSARVPLPQTARTWLVVLAVIASLLGIHYWQERPAAELESIDAELLAGDVPLGAYTNKELGSWLRDASR